MVVHLCTNVTQPTMGIIFNFSELFLPRICVFFLTQHRWVKYLPSDDHVPFFTQNWVNFTQLQFYSCVVFYLYPRIVS